MYDGRTANGNVKTFVPDCGRHAVHSGNSLHRGQWRHFPKLGSCLSRAPEEAAHGEDVNPHIPPPGGSCSYGMARVVCLNTDAIAGLVCRSATPWELHTKHSLRDHRYPSLKQFGSS